MGNGQYQVQLQTLDNFYDTTDSFSVEDGFMVAAAVTDFAAGGGNVDITDPEIGEIKFYLKNWDVTWTSSIINFKEIETKVCTEADLNDHEGTYSDVSAFYPVKQSSVQYVKKYGPGVMRCIKNLDDLKLWGNYDTDKTSNLMVVFEKCDIAKRPSGAKCKTDAQIEEWMQFKYILTLENEAKFIQHNFGKKRIEKRSQAHQYALNYSTRSDFVNVLGRELVHFSDRIINVLGVLDTEQPAFIL